MSLCCRCDYAVHERYKGYAGRWLCTHPCRYEIGNAGDFTYPGNFSPAIKICDTSAEDFSQRHRSNAVLAEVQTPRWCYYDVVARAQAEQTGFDPDAQHSILWPEKILPELKPLREVNGHETSATS